jgi:ankyrin repeat protein
VLEAGVSVQESLEGQTALLSAVRAGHLALARWLVEAGARPLEEMDVKGNTAFMMAAWSGHLHILEWLFAVYLSGTTASTQAL